MSDYEYRYIEQSVDVRTWKITSAKQLTEDEVREYGVESNWQEEGAITKFPHDKVKVEFEGVEYGDDTQTEIIGDTKEEDDE